MAKEIQYNHSDTETLQQFEKGASAINIVRDLENNGLYRKCIDGRWRRWNQREKVL